jgi:hypothetical protein
VATVVQDNEMAAYTRIGMFIAPADEVEPTVAAPPLANQDQLPSALAQAIVQLSATKNSTSSLVEREYQIRAREALAKSKLLLATPTKDTLRCPTLSNEILRNSRAVFTLSHGTRLLTEMMEVCVTLARSNLTADKHLFWAFFHQTSLIAR